jgi:prepilin-type N-terminal cleavage/methylation domain-containing protein
MQRFPSRRAFTLIEMITVIAIIAIISGMIISLAGLMTTKQNRAKAQGDITAMVSACEAYKTDNGGYPQDVPAGSASNSVTNDLDPRQDMNPSDAKYQKASVFLYKQLSGDENANGKIDASETGRKYASEFFKTSRFDVGFRNSGKITYLADPWGYSYGYSTAGLKAEQDYRVELETDANASRAANPPGFNPTFDMWSTAGSTGPKSGTKDEERGKWIKNW